MLEANDKEQAIFLERQEDTEEECEWTDANYMIPVNFRWMGCFITIYIGRPALKRSFEESKKPHVIGFNYPPKELSKQKTG